MKRIQAIAMYQELQNIRLDKMSDEMTDAILANTLAVAEVNDAMAKAQEELRMRTVGTLDRDRIVAYDDLVIKMNALEGSKRMAVQAVINDNYHDVRMQLERFNKALSSWLEKDVNIELSEVDRKEFCKACRESEFPFTPSALQRVAPMFKTMDIKGEVDNNEIEELLN